MAIHDVITPVLTILGSGIVAALVSSSLSEGKERWQIRRQKAEELFKTLHKYRRDLDKHHFNNGYYLTGRLNRQQYNDAARSEMNPTDDYRDLQMNIYLYEPRLIPSFDKLIETRTTLNAIVSRCEVVRREAERVDQASFREFNLGWDQLIAACDELQREIIEIGRRIADEGTQAERMVKGASLAIANRAGKVYEFISGCLNRRKRAGQGEAGSGAPPST